MSRDIRITYASARVNAGLSQKEACVKLGVSEKTLIGYENGKVIPRWDTHNKMASLYGIPQECLCPPQKL